MAVVSRLQRTGKPKQAYYRVVAIDKTEGATGKPIEVLGSYDPRAEHAGKKVQLKITATYRSPSGSIATKASTVTLQKPKKPKGLINLKSLLGRFVVPTLF